jgi:hypothetical protein
MTHRDTAGIALATLCAIHCAAVPLAAGIAAAAGLSWLFEERLEWFFVASSAGIGCISLLPAYWRVHGCKQCLALFFGGMASILTGRLATAEGSDTPFVIFGAALIVCAHGVNQYLSRRCGNCR